MMDRVELGCAVIVVACLAVLAWMLKDVLFGVGYY